MIPTTTKNTNWTYHLPGRPGEGDLPCVRSIAQRTVQSYWRLEPEDRDVLVDAPSIQVRVQGLKTTVHMGYGNDDGAVLEAGEFEPQRFEGAWQSAMGLTDEARTFLLTGGLFVLRLGALPPPPVSVWLAPSEVLAT